MCVRACVRVCDYHLLCSSYHQRHIHLQPVDSQLTGSTCLHTVTGGEEEEEEEEEEGERRRRRRRRR